jgi:hypothetical protein
MTKPSSHEVTQLFFVPNIVGGLSGLNFRDSDRLTRTRSDFIALDDALKILSSIA